MLFILISKACYFKVDLKINYLLPKFCYVNLKPNSYFTNSSHQSSYTLHKKGSFFFHLKANKKYAEVKII